MKSNLNLLTYLKEIHHKINTQESLNNNLKMILETSKKLINYDYCGILTKNEKDDKLSPFFLLPKNLFDLTSSEYEFLDWIYNEGTSFISNNVSKEKIVKYNYLTVLKDENSFIGTPLIFNKNKIKGVIFALSKKSNTFSDDDVIILENFAGVIVSIINCYETREQTITAMRRIDRELYSEIRDTKRVMDKIVQCAIEITGADHGCLVRYDALNNQLECRYPSDCKKCDKYKEKNCIFKLNDPHKIVSEVFREEKTKKVKNTINEGYTSNLCYNNGKQIQSQVAVPLLGESDKPFGVLILESTTESHFSKWHLVLLNALAEFGIIAFRNSKIFKKLEMLSDASNVLLKEYENKTLEEKFDFIVEKTIKLLDAELCSLFLVEENNLKLVTSFAIDSAEGIKKREEDPVILPIISGKGTGVTGAIAYSKKIFNEYGEILINHPAIKNAETSDFLPSKFCYSELAYPMLDEEGELLGLFKAYNKLDENGKPLISAGFSKEFDEPLMEILTTKLIIAIKNSQLVNNLSDSLNKLENYEIIIENTADPVARTTKHGVITFMNEGALNLFGNLYGKKVYDYYFSDEISSGLERAKEIMRKLKDSVNGRIRNVETIFTSKEGNPIPVSLSASLIKNEKGKIIGTIGISKDLREIKTLLKVGNSLLSTHNIEEILKKICDECLKLPKSNRAYIKLYDMESDSLLFRALSSSNPDDELPKEASPKGRGMTGFVFMTETHYFSVDVTKEPPEKFYRIFPDVKSKIVVPISSVDKETGEINKLGVISVDSIAFNAFSVNDMYFLSTLANQAAAAIENANLITSKTKIITELTALETVQETITKTLDIDLILESVLDVVMKILKFDYAYIAKVDHYTRMITAVKGRNIPEEFMDDGHSLDSNDIQAWVIQNKQEVKLSDWDERLDREIYERYNHKNLVRIFLPILSRDEAYGTLETGYYKENRQDITDEEIETLRKVVNLAGIVIDQAYLRKEQQLLGNQLQALNQENIHIQSSRTEEDVVRHTFNSLERIGYSKAMLSLLNVTTGKIEGRYALGTNWKKIIDDTKRELTGNDILAIAMRKKRSILSKNCESDPTCHKDTIKKAKIKSQYVIPLILNNEPMGTLQIDLSDQQGLVKVREDILKHRMEVLETFASQIAIAIRNVRDRKMIDLLETTLSETAHEFRSPLHPLFRIVKLDNIINIKELMCICNQ